MYGFFKELSLVLIKRFLFSFPSVVRQAGVHSLGRLAADRPFLAAAALDHLADMFNDEIDKVIFPFSFWRNLNLQHLQE